mmetsp:Transcript_24443/g.45344  ORF Transcript_24443/g.45344 Transcript_24443/m.45344 type:complete len:810 (-) Transcript_24443:49-2478(-)
MHAQSGILATRDAVIAHLEALQSFVLRVDASGQVTRRLVTAITYWGSVNNGSMTTGLAAQSCEVVVATLRLLRGDLGLSTREAVTPYTSAFLVLACTVRVFEGARDLPAIGQTVTLYGLQNAAAQHLNGACGVVVRFDPASGRFIVRLRPEDPATDWKKVRAENLLAADDSSPAASQAVSAARAHGRSCLEAVADIFDDLLQDMLLEAPELEDGSLSKFMAAELATAMWEVLVCCAGDGGLQLSGASLLELCGSTGLCSLFARYVFSAHLSFHMSILGCPSILGFSMSAGDTDGSTRRLKTLQESLARSYCELYQPAAFWRETDQAGDNSPIATLQAEFDAHIRAIGEAAVNFGVMPAFIDAVDFHLSWVSTAARPGPMPLVLPVLLSRLFCAILASTSEATGSALRRHLQMNTAGLIDIVLTFTELMSLRVASEGPGATPTPAELLVALRALLDAVVAVVDIGLWSLGPEVAMQVEAIASILLEIHRTAGDPAVLARLTLIFFRRPPDSSTAARLAAACSRLDQGLRAKFCWQLGACGRRCRWDPGQVQQLAQDWLHAAGGLQVIEARDAAIVEPTWESEVQNESNELNLLIEKCLRELPDSLREAETPRPAPPEMQAPEVDVPAAAHLASAETLAPLAPLGAEAFPLPQESNPGSPSSRLSMLDMPALPGATSPTSTAKKVLQKRKGKKLGRSDIGQIRGVDPAAAPQELRCAIDGKVVGNPVRSPYGHLFERETLEQWVSMCGSVCPITGNPLRLEDCVEDHTARRQVIEWVRAAKAEHKRCVQERRAQRQAMAAAGGSFDTGDLL